MPKLLIIADDLTGALDTGIQFSKIGVDTVVSINPGELVSDTDVIVADTESRHLLPETAYERVRRVLSITGEVGYVYKKTDSTLRGNTGAEFK
ncbi:MAG TPA: four-carbon acid sugar kinase family protein, partial [bacterium]|nr:four-carbon acid sugar kinase family protein [bacterium]